MTLLFLFSTPVPPLDTSSVLPFWLTKCVGIFSPQQIILQHQLDVLRLSSVLPGVRLQAHRWRAQTHETLPALLQMPVARPVVVLTNSFKWEGPLTPSSVSINFRLISSRGHQAQENSQTEEMLRAKYVGKGTPVSRRGALPFQHFHVFTNLETLWILPFFWRSNWLHYGYWWLSTSFPLLSPELAVGLSGAESSNPVVSHFLPLATSPHL